MHPMYGTSLIRKPSMVQSKLAKKRNYHIEGDLVSPIRIPDTTHTPVLSKKKQQHLTEMMSYDEWYSHFLLKILVKIK